MQCGCTVEATGIEGKDVYSVQQCPLHKAAPDLLEVLKRCKQFLHEVHCRWPEDADFGGSVLIDVDKAIALAKPITSKEG